ncbi:MAG: LPS assembly protein LptD [Candidatus Omnitrophica bacterium]|nr:LPS assembly protein LptD [Candidatus Omnitrophota bacterium]
MLKRLSCLGFILVLSCASVSYAEELVKAGAKSQPLIINGDSVEYSADAQEVTASGNVEIISGDTRLTCQKLTVNTQTKEGIASGHARLEDKKGIVEGEKLIYNFQTKVGTIVDAQFRSSPFFGKARTVDKEGGKEIIAHYGYASTCSFDRPHYRVSSKQINIIPKEKIQTRDDYLYLGPVPLMYLARFNQFFEKPLMHVSVLPGKRKDWGYYLLSEWTMNLAENIDGRGYLDFRTRLGWSEGFGLNYAKTPVGSGDFKFYFTDEKPPDGKYTDKRGSYQRYFFRLRHKWDIDSKTNFVAEVYKIRDEITKFADPNTNILKDFFYREYEKDSNPSTYGLFHHSFSYSSIDVLLQKRTNHWFDQLDKMPEIKYVMPELQLGDSPFYFDSDSTFTTFNKKDVTAPQTPDDLTVSRLDSTNKISLPLKVAFLSVSPFVKVRETIYDKSATDSNLPGRTTFYFGASVSTKFYRVFDVKTDFLGLNLDRLRHVITPTIDYSYNPEPTVSVYKLKQIDSVDRLTSSNAVSLGLTNKLQTKRKDASGKETSIDLAELNINTAYTFAPRITYATNLIYINNIGVNQTDSSSKFKTGADFSDVFLKWKILPYAWLRMEGNATYKLSGAPTDSDYANYHHFTNVNYDVNFDFAPERSFGIGQRYQRKGQSQVTASFKWRINPKWKFSIYQRYNLKGFTDTSVYPNVFTDQGSLEQQFTIARNLHCWDMEFTYDIRKHHGNTIYFVFRLKAFPENEFNINQSYNKPNTS